MSDHEKKSPIVKICGINTVEDAEACVSFGADWVGINFWKKSPRFCVIEQAKKIVTNVGNQIRVVGLFVNATQKEIEETKQKTGIEWVQLHGNEDSSFLNSLLPNALKAIRIRNKKDAHAALEVPGEFILLDSFSKSAPGGTGESFDWSLAKPVAEKRDVILAGGLTPDNVSAAIKQVRPAGVDVASGVESSPGIKDYKLVEKFIRSSKQS